MLFMLNRRLHSFWPSPRPAALTALLLLLSALTAPAVQAQSDPGVPGVVTFFNEFQDNQGRTRRVVYLRPSNPAPLAPAILTLHFGGGSPDDMIKLTQLALLVRDTGVWAIVPEASGRAWNHDPRRDSSRQPDDVEFLTRVVDSALGTFSIDATRVFVMGFSSGGYMAHRMACMRASRFAGLGYVGATITNSLAMQCSTASRMPTIGMHGTRDRRVPYRERVGVMSAPGTAQFHAQRNGCVNAPSQSLLPDIADDGTTVTLDRWDGCNIGGPVHFYTIIDGGHTWPGNDLQFGLLGRTTQDVDATRAIWAFFSGLRR